MPSAASVKPKPMFHVEHERKGKSMHSIGTQVTTPEGRGTLLNILDAEHPMRAHNQPAWTYADGRLIEPTTILYVVTLRDSHHAVYAEDELRWEDEPPTA